MDMPLIVQQKEVELQNIDSRLIQTAINAKESMDRAVAQNTKRAYETDWNHFVQWCTERSVSYLPTTNQIVALYIQDLADSGYKASTIQRRMSAINTKHKEAGHDPISTRFEPLHKVWQGIKNTIGTAQKGKAAAVLDDIKAMVDTLDDRMIGIRDRALLLLGFAGAFRRSELVALNVEDVEFVQEGIVATIRRSKTDQEGQGHKVAIPYGSHIETCPVRALQEWLEASGITDGPLFRGVTKHGQVLQERLSDKGVSRMVKRCAKSAGLKDIERYGAHSLRAGFATTAAQKGVSERIIMKQTRHKSVQMVRKYIRDGNLFRENAAAEIGL